jgi:DNA-binding MarR family transcriptional regulator
MTEAGRALFAAMAPAHASWIEETMAGLDRTEAAMLWQALGDLKASVNEAAQTVRARQKARP